MSVDHLLPFPNDILELVKALTFHPGRVVRVDDPTFSGRVMVEILNRFGKIITNWISVAGGIGNGPGATQSGMHNPLRPGQSVLVFCPGGNVDKQCCIPGPPTLSEPGNPGSRVA